MIHLEKPRSEIEIINEVINKQKTEEEYFQSRSDSEGKLSLNLPELEILKQKPNLLKQFLLSFSVKGRLRILLTKEMLGMTQSSLYSKYGFPNNQIRLLKGQVDKSKSRATAEIRKMELTGQPRGEILATLSVFTRIPVSWIREEKPLLTNKWYVHHFYDIPDVHLSFDKLIEYIKETESITFTVENKHTRPNFPFLYDIRAIILHIGSKEFFLRTSFFEAGGLIIELFNEYIEATDFIKLVKLFELSLGSLEIRYCETVIEGHINLVIIPNRQEKGFSIPKEYKKF